MARKKDPRPSPRRPKTAARSAGGGMNDMFEAQVRRDAQFVDDMALMEAKLAQIEKIVARQRELILEMRSKGMDAKVDEERLAEFEDAMAQRRAALEALRAMHKLRTN